jgi:hypothetical protein
MALADAFNIKEGQSMKISELLREAEKKKKVSGLPSAPSIDDEPEDDIEDDTADDVEDDEGDDNVDNIKSIGGDLGDDLYSVTVYNTTDDFANISQVTSHTWKLENTKSPEVNDYLSQSDHDISNEKIISCVIYNARNGEFFRFNSGQDGSGFTPDIHSLVGSGVVDADQVGILKNIESVGKKYTQALQNISWTAGQEAEGPGAKQLYNVLSRLKDVLNLREPVERIHNVKISDEQRKKNAEYSKGALERVRAKMAARKAEKQNQGPGRELR